MVGRLRRRPRQPGVPDRGPGRVDRCARHHGRLRPVDDLDQPRRAAEQRPRRAGGDVPEQVGRHRALRPRGLAQVPHADRPARHVRLLDRLVGRALDQRARCRHPDPGRVVLRLHLGRERGHLRPQPGDRDRHRPDHPGLGLQRLRRAPGGLVRLRHGRAADHPRLRPDVPALRHGRVVERQHELGDRRQRRPGARARVAVLHVLVVVRDRGGGHLRARVPGHRAGHRPALRAAALFSAVVYVLLPLGVGGTLGTAAIGEGALTLTFYAHAFEAIVGSGLGERDDRVRGRRA